MGFSPQTDVGAIMMKFDFDTKTIEQFTQGDCWLLAWGLHALKGYPLWFLTRTGDETYRRDRWSHVVVQISDDEFLDVEGVKSAEEMENRWYNTLVQLPESSTQTYERYIEYLMYDENPECYRHGGNADPATVTVKIIEMLKEPVAA